MACKEIQEAFGGPRLKRLVACGRMIAFQPFDPQYEKMKMNPNLLEIAVQLTSLRTPKVLLLLYTSANQLLKHFSAFQN
jgi:hypothetical protein